MTARWTATNARRLQLRTQGGPTIAIETQQLNSGSINFIAGSAATMVLEAYNEAVGSLEGNVLIKARKFKELQAANGGEEIKSIEPIDRVPRMLQAPELTDGLPFHEEEVEQV